MMAGHYSIEERTIAVLGLGYVGLPLAEAFAAKYKVIGFDINTKVVRELRQRIASNSIVWTSNEEDLDQANFFIVAVPTPVDAYNVPDIRFLRSASQLIGRHLQAGDCVVYESTVYPGCTEEDCIPILEATSGLNASTDFMVGYSPERINPGDPVHTLKNIKKIVSGNNPKSLAYIAHTYADIIEAGIVEVSSIKVAEAAKVIENAQRDVNISFVNELALIFDRMGIDTQEVLDAAASKWNFIPFRPGLVGGHCISVDPYYLAYKAEQLGYYPQVILSGRSVNSSIGKFIAQKIVKLLIRNDIKVKGAKVLILGFAFKENCADFRNTKVWDICNEFKQYEVDFTIVDERVDKAQIVEKYKEKIYDLSDIQADTFEAVILAVPHAEFLSIDYQKLLAAGKILFDVKSVLPKSYGAVRL